MATTAQPANLAPTTFAPMSAQRVLVFGGIALIASGMLFGDIFAVFVLHQNGGQTGEALLSASHGGNTWTMVDVAPVQVEPHVDQFSRLAIANDGTIYVVWQRCIEGGEPNLDCGGTKAKILLSKSTDGGSTWSKPAQVATVRVKQQLPMAPFHR